MARRNADLLLTIIFAIMTIATNILTPGFTLLRATFAVPLVLFFTGYAWMLFFVSPLGMAKRFLLSVGLSFTIAILGCLVLNISPYGVEPSALLVLLSGVTLAVTLIAALRLRYYSPVGEVFLNIKLSLYQKSTFGAALLVLMTAIVLARQPTSPDGVNGYTLLWLMPAHSNENTTEFRLGFTSKEFAPTEYHVQLYADEDIIGDWASISLKPGESWESTQTLPSKFQDTPSVRALLFRADSPAWPPYRVAVVRR